MQTAFGLKSAAFTSFLALQAVGLPCRFQTCQALQSCQPIPDNKSFFLYIYTSYWFCFSGELYVPYNTHVKEKLLTDLLFFLFYLLKQSQRCSEFQEEEKQNSPLNRACQDSGRTWQLPNWQYFQGHFCKIQPDTYHMSRFVIPYLPPLLVN